MASPEKMTFREPRTHTHYGKKYFNVEYNGANYRVRLFPFQETQPEPKEIHCLVSVDEAKRVHIVQDLQPYLEESYSSGCDYEFVVRRAYADKHYYEVEDRYGLYFRLNTDRILLERQVVTCRVEILTRQCRRRRTALIHLQRKQPILHRVAQSEYRSCPQYPGRTLSSSAH